MGGDKEATYMLGIAERLYETLNSGNTRRSVAWTEDEVAGVKAAQLITTKPVLYVCNVDEAGLGTENPLVQRVRDYAGSVVAWVVVVVESVVVVAGASATTSRIRESLATEPVLGWTDRTVPDLVSTSPSAVWRFSTEMFSGAKPASTNRWVACSWVSPTRPDGISIAPGPLLTKMVTVEPSSAEVSAVGA